MDQTLICSTPDFVKLNNAYFGVEITEDEYREHWTETRWSTSCSKEEWMAKQGAMWARYALEAGFYRDLPAMPGALEGLRELTRMGAELAILTSRRKEFREDTAACLAREFPGIEFAKMLFLGAYDGETVPDTRHMLTKGDMVAELGARALVDDQPKHALAAMERGVPAVLFGLCPESEGVVADEARGLYRAMNWPEAVPILERILT